MRSMPGSRWMADRSPRRDRRAAGNAARREWSESGHEKSLLFRGARGTVRDEKKRWQGGVCASTSETHETSRSVRQWWRRNIAAAAASSRPKSPAFLFFCEILRNLEGAVPGIGLTNHAHARWLVTLVGSERVHFLASTKHSGHASTKPP